MVNAKQHMYNNIIQGSFLARFKLYLVLLVLLTTDGLKFGLNCCLILGWGLDALFT